MFFRPELCSGFLFLSREHGQIAGQRLANPLGSGSLLDQDVPDV